MNTEVKIKLEGLQIGMYVSKIDRPWMDIPIQLEGMLINSNEQIDMIRTYCEHVYIDTNKGRTASPMYWVFDKPQQAHHDPVDKGNNEFTLLRKTHYESSSSLDEEIHVAQEIYQSVNYKITTTFDSLRLDKNLDVELIQDAVISTVESVIRNPAAFKLVLELKKSDEYSYNHALGTSVWCAQFGRHLGLEKQNINDLAMGGLLLDIGKTQIDQDLLNKTGQLTKQEINLFRSHVDLGIRILVKADDIPHEVMRMVATHHERFDGSGYPQALKDSEVPIYGKIAGLADSFDAMTCVRPFQKRAHSPHEAISDLYNMRGKRFSADLVEQFIQTVGVYPTGSLVELHSGEVGIVFSVNGLKRLRPTVMMILDSDKKPLDNFYPINLSEQTDLSIKQALERGAYGINMGDLFL